MKKMEFIRILTITCLAMTNSAYAEVTFSDDPMEQQQLAFADNDEYAQQQEFSDSDIQPVQQQASADDSSAVQQVFAENNQAELQRAFPDDSQASQQQAFVENNQPAQQQGFDVINQSAQQQAAAKSAEPALPQQEKVASADTPQQTSQQQNLSRKQVVAIANASDQEKQKTADAITAVLQGKNPETVEKGIEQAEKKDTPDTKKTASTDTSKPPVADAIKASSKANPKVALEAVTKAAALPADLTNIKHLTLRSKDKFAYHMDCYIKSNDVICKGSLGKQPTNFKAYESTLVGKLANSTIKGNVNSFSRINGSKASKDCDTTNETNWPMTITLNANHEAIMETGPVKSYTNIKGNPNCAGASEQTYPGKKVSMKWRAIG